MTSYFLHLNRHWRPDESKKMFQIMQLMNKFTSEFQELQADASCSMAFSITLSGLATLIR